MVYSWHACHLNEIENYVTYCTTHTDHTLNILVVLCFLVCDSCEQVKFRSTSQQTIAPESRLQDVFTMTSGR